MLTEILAVLLALSTGAADPTICKGNPAVIGKCFVVHGRFGAWNGAPTFRISPIGTKRVLGVTGPKPGDQPILPDDLPCGFDCEVVADFEVCPFSKSIPEVMQRVCVQSANNIVKRQRTGR
jgi:hypothetical protein